MTGLHSPLTLRPLALLGLSCGPPAWVLGWAALHVQSGLRDIWQSDLSLILNLESQWSQSSPAGLLSLSIIGIWPR